MHHLFGTIHRTGDSSTIVMRRIIATSPQDAWDAITVPERAARWLGALSGELRAGGSYHLAFDPDDPTQVVDGEIRDCQPSRALTVSWQAPGEQPSVVEVSLAPCSQGTELVLTHSGLRQPSSDTGHAAGWQVHLDQLAEGLHRNDWSDRWEAWAELERAYSAATTPA